MSSRERWDVVLCFLSGHLARHGEIVARGPVVRMGVRPGAGGLDLSGYRGLDDRQAVITVYEDGVATLTPVGTSQVRMAPHEHVDWSEIQTLREPAYLSDGCAFHLGPPGRGVSVRFVRSQPLAVYTQGHIQSEAANYEIPSHHAVDPTSVAVAGGELTTDGGRPAWFIPGMVFVTLATALAVIVPLLNRLNPEVLTIGPVMEEREVYEVVDFTMKVDPELLEGFNEPFLDFLMTTNASLAEDDGLKKPENWDTRLLDFVTRSAEVHARDWAFWKRLEQIEVDYRLVTETMKEQGLPLVFAAIPYQESAYHRDATSPVCAGSYWQFMPEVANRAGLVLQDCRIPGMSTLWSPSGQIHKYPLDRNPYILLEGDDPEDASAYKCRMPVGSSPCARDDRTDLRLATRAAVELLYEPMRDDTLRRSGAAVQIAIATHNAGYDDGRFTGGANQYNLLPAYKKWIGDRGLKYDPNFIGEQIQCTDNSFASTDTCGSVLIPETQHYVYSIIAIHFLAVCYYAKNYGDAAAVYEDWVKYTREDGYCNRLEVPSRSEVLEHSG
jgi:hypothetical protein